jgi:hypothetical protein
MTFLRKHWFDLGGILVIGIVIFLIFNYTSMSRYEVLMWISLITLFLHQMEEYRIVGTFPGMCNKAMYNSSMPDRYPLNTNTALIINVAIGWTVYLLAALFAEKAVWLGIASLMVSLGNLIGHTTLFNIKGKTWFNAGLFTSWFCFLPVIYFFIKITRADHLATLADYLIGVPLGILINVLGVVKLIDWMKDPSTQFIFPRRCLLPKDRQLSE